jgi:hypothetical protein
LHKAAEFVNKNPPKVLEFKNKMLGPNDSTDFEIIFLIYQAIKYPKRMKEIGSYNLDLIPLFLNGFKCKKKMKCF